MKGFRYCLFSKIWYPFELLRLSLRKNLSLKKECRPLERPRQSVREKLSCVRTARAIRREKLSSTVRTVWLSVQRIVIRFNGSNYPFQNIVSRYTVPNHFHPILGDQGAVSRLGRKGASEVQEVGGGGEPLGTDSHQTISKRSSEFWLQKLSLRFLPTQLTATKNLKSFSFLYNLVLYSFLIFFPFLYYLNSGLTYTVNVH